jgi:hypothetical protein
MCFHNILNVSLILVELKQGWKKTMKMNRKKKKRTTLDPSSHFGSPNHEIFFKLFFGQTN